MNTAGKCFTNWYVLEPAGLSRLEEVEHEHSMAQLEKEQSEEEVTETYTEEIIYYSPRKSGHYTSKEVSLVTGSHYLLSSVVIPPSH